MFIAIVPSLILSILLSLFLTLALNLFLGVMLAPAFLVGLFIFLGAMALLRLFKPV